MKKRKCLLIIGCFLFASSLITTTSIIAQRLKPKKEKILHLQHDANMPPDYADYPGYYCIFVSTISYLNVGDNDILIGVDIHEFKSESAYYLQWMSQIKLYGLYP